MVAKLIVLLAAIVAIILGASYFTFRYFEREAERKHERRMARDQRDYETVMEYAEEESDPEPARENETE